MNPVVASLCVPLALVCSWPAYEPAQKPEATAPTKVAVITLAPALGEKDAASALSIVFPLLPDARFDFVTCEALLEKDHDLGVFAVKPGASEWKHEGDEWSYAWKLADQIELSFHAKPERDSVLVRYDVKNVSAKKLDRIQIGPCLPTLGAPDFYPGTAEQARTGPAGRAARVGVKDYSELWNRLFLWRGGKKFAFNSSASAKSEKHLAFVRKGMPSTTWSWWVNAGEAFDAPFIAVVSKDGTKTLALGFESSAWASSNSNDPRACFHLFPAIGDLAPGESKSMTGRIYAITGDADAAFERFKKDFPKSARD